jgi:hypothetical protein
VADRVDRFLGPGNVPSRSTADGSIFLFESRAALTPPYDNEGHIEIYRFSDADGTLTCVSCNPTGAAADSDAHLQSRNPGLLTSVPPVDAVSKIPNVTADGLRVFFQSDEALALGDVDGKTDVYEWTAEGAGACEREGGCLSLISSGRSAEDDYLYAVTPDGHDVFFWSGDRLVSQDPDGTPSIYDARIGGGFPDEPPPPNPCLGEACQPLAVAPNDLTPASIGFKGAGNVSAGAHHRRCRKHMVRRKGRCVKRRTKSRNHAKPHRRAGHKQGGSK